MAPMDMYKSLQIQHLLEASIIQPFSIKEYLISLNLAQ